MNLERERENRERVCRERQVEGVNQSSPIGRKNPLHRCVLHSADGSDQRSLWVVVVVVVCVCVVEKVVVCVANVRWKRKRAGIRFARVSYVNAFVHGDRR
jgi:hypothetical protein